ncbi:hypothetical protein TELCIR_18031, partial [Teladorsagia circumcincta]
TDTPVSLRSVLYIPQHKFSILEYAAHAHNRECGLSLYAKRVLIKPNAVELLPNYLHFIMGVVDSEDIPLNLKQFRDINKKELLDWIKTTLGSVKVYDISGNHRPSEHPVMLTIKHEMGAARHLLRTGEIKDMEHLIYDNALITSGLLKDTSGMMQNLVDVYMDMPPITRAYTTACILTTMAVIICGIFVQMVFLGQAFTIMLVYIWSRRNPHIQNLHRSRQIVTETIRMDTKDLQAIVEEIVKECRQKGR